MYTPRIATVEFGLFSPEEIRQRSVVEVTTKQIYDRNLPKDHGLNDHRMGTVDRRYRCGTCGHNIKDCAGHFGHIELGYPLYHVGYIDVVRKLLSCVCFACSRLITDAPDTEADADDSSDSDAEADGDTTDADSDSDDDDVEPVPEPVESDDDIDDMDPVPEPPPIKNNKVKLKGQLGKIYEQARKVKQCPSCGHPVPRYVRKGLSLDAVWKSKEWDVTKKDPETQEYVYFESDEELKWATRPFNSHVAYNILRNISSASCQKLGIRVRPEYMMLLVLPVPPPVMRPTIMATEGSRERGQNDLTSMLQEVVKNSLRVKKQLLTLRNSRLTDPVDDNGTSKRKKKAKRARKTGMQSFLVDFADDTSDDDADDANVEKDYSALRYPQFAQDWDLARSVGHGVEDVEYAPEHKPLVKARDDLQMAVTAYMNNDVKGVKQCVQRSGVPKKSLTRRLKSKEGRIRGNLMGKRVNFSARSVISPDPNLGVEEVGVPVAIALVLTYPERVTHHNYHTLTQRVLVGHGKLHGAKYIETDDGRHIQLRFFDAASKPPPCLRFGWTVHRYIQDGDYVIFNRQPSLHRESMMGHRVRILKTGRTFRMNVSCTTPYNADYDACHYSQTKIYTV